MRLGYIFSGEFEDGLFHFFVYDDEGNRLRELTKKNFWKWIEYFDLPILGR